MASVIMWSADIACTACGGTIADSEPRRIFDQGDATYAITHDTDHCDDMLLLALVAQG